MIKSALNFADEIKSKYAERMYDIDYQWYFGWRGTEIPKIEENSYNAYRFASVGKDGNVIGYICYDTNLSSNSCINFGIISFDRGNLNFVRDVRQAINDIFYKYNFNRIEFHCFDGNPALRGYRNFIKKFGGREVGRLRKAVKLLDGKLYDTIIFEILKSDIRKTEEQDAVDNG